MVDSITNVIYSQQVFANSHAYNELCDLKEIVEESIHIHQDSLSVHGIQVFRDYKTNPRINIQKTKLTYVLANLFANAIQAMEKTKAEEHSRHFLARRMTIKPRNGLKGSSIFVPAIVETCENAL